MEQATKPEFVRKRQGAVERSERRRIVATCTPTSTVHAPRLDRPASRS